MLGFVQNWLAPRANPIGVDFGSDCLRLAQVQLVGNDYQLIAAASADVPSHVRNDPAARLAFFTETTRDLLAQGNFRGRSAILGLPASTLFVQHLRLPKMTDDALKKSLAWESRGKLPIDPSQALLRHLVAGDVYQDQEPRSEVIVMAASRELVNQFLIAAAKAKLDVVGMNVEPKALIDCFQHVYRRKSDSDVTNMFVDIGSVGTRAIVSRGGKIHFVRHIPLGGEHLNRAVALSLGVSADEAKLMRIKLCAQQPAMDETREKKQVTDPDARIENNFTATHTAESGLTHSAGADRPSQVSETPFAHTASAVATQVTGRAMHGSPASSHTPYTDTAATSSGAVEQASFDALNNLTDELDLCRRYHEATFPSMPVDRLVFVGGESKHRTLCQHIARGMGLAAQLGDPMVRMGRVSQIGIESGIDRRQPQPNWAVAIGLSLGPKSDAPVEASK